MTVTTEKAIDTHAPRDGELGKQQELSQASEEYLLANHLKTTGKRRKSRRKKRLGALLKWASHGGRHHRSKHDAGSSTASHLSPSDTARSDDDATHEGTVHTEHDEQKRATSDSDRPSLDRSVVAARKLFEDDDDDMASFENAREAEEEEIAGEPMHSENKVLAEGTMAEKSLCHPDSIDDGSGKGQGTMEPNRSRGIDLSAGQEVGPMKTMGTPEVEKKERMANDENTSEAPAILRPWIYLHRSVPRFLVWKVSGTSDLDFSLAFVAVLALSSVRLLFLRLLVSAGWPAESSAPGEYIGWAMTLEAAGSLTSIVQSSLLSISLAACFLAQPYIPSARMDASPPWWRDAAEALIQLCMGCMLYDALKLFLIKGWDDNFGWQALDEMDCVFASHHLAMAVYMMTARLVGAGHQSAMILVYTGEVTSPIMHAHAMLRIAMRLRCCQGAVTDTLLTFVEYAFIGTYCLFRIAVGPVAAAHLTYDLLFTRQGRQNVPLWLSIPAWMPLCWGVTIGPMLWIKDALEMLV